MTSVNKLDHTVINVGSNMDRAEIVFSNLGFVITPRGYHSTGSYNHLMMFGTDYLELLGIPAGGDHQRPDIANAPLGVNGLVFKTDSADETYAHLRSVGQAGDPPRSFSRPVDVDGSTQDAKFRTVTVRADVFPGGRVYFCEHSTPELVWRPEWQTHANATVAIPEFVVTSQSADNEAREFGKLLGCDVQNNSAAFDGGQVTVLAVSEYADRYGALASPMAGRPSIFGALVFKSQNRAALNDLVQGGLDGLECQIESSRTVVRISDFDAVIEFVD